MFLWQYQHLVIFLIIRTSLGFYFNCRYSLLCTKTAVKDKEYTAPGLPEGTPELVRRRRHWELWSTQDKNLFFEGLFEASYFLQ